MRVDELKKVVYAECQAAAAKFTEEGGAMDQARYLDIEADVMRRLPIRLLTDAVKTRTVTTTAADGSKLETRVEEPVFKSVEWCDAHWSKLLENCLRNALGAAPVRKLCIPSNPDVRRWLSALKLLFPNVVDVSATAVGCYDFVMSLRGEEPKGDRHILLLYSESVGGVGKDTFQRGLTEFLSDAYGATCTHSPSSCGTYLSPDSFKAHVTVFEEMSPAEWPSGVINNIVDREPAAFNQKYGASGQFVNSAALIGTSNELPARRNNRRWNVVEYITRDMRGRPMPPDDVRLRAYRDFVEACPVGADKSMFGRPDKDRQFMVQDVIELVQDNRNEQPSTPSRLLRKAGRDNDHQLRSQMRNMFYQLQAEGRFPQKWSGNSFSATHFNWKKIAEFFDQQQQRFTVDSDDPLQACAAKWDDLIYRLCGPEPDGPTSRPDEGPCATTAEPSGRDTARSGLARTRPAVYDRLTLFADARTPTDDPSAQYVVNCVRDDGSKVGPRDTADGVRPVLMAFEADSATLEEQAANLRAGAEPKLTARVFSGKKSYHYEVEVPEDVSLDLMELRNRDGELARRVWHRLYEDVAGTLFKNVRILDMNCKSWLRKCRNPGGLREVERDGRTAAVEQTAEFFEGPSPLNWDGMYRWALEREEAALKALREAAARRPKAQKRDASKSDKVVKYLATPYLKTHGNGDSDSSLYSAICACKCAGDDASLDAVLCKARSERWTETELTRKVRDAERFAASRP